MKKYNSIILSFLFICISCNYIFPKQEKSPKEKLFPFLWITLATCYTGTPKVKSVSYIDNMDGTVTANMLYDMDRPNCVSLPKTEIRTVFIKKCMQGQVYQKDQNNCRGKGSEADGWGAEKYQYCPTNDRACEKETGDRLREYVADETKSPAAIACAQETFLGKRWGLPEGHEVFTANGSQIFDFFMEIPNYQNSGISSPPIYSLGSIIPLSYPGNETEIKSVGFRPLERKVGGGTGPNKNESYPIFCIST